MSDEPENLPESKPNDDTAAPFPPNGLKIVLLALVTTAVAWTVFCSLAIVPWVESFSEFFDELHYAMVISSGFVLLAFAGTLWRATAIRDPRTSYRVAFYFSLAIGLLCGLNVLSIHWQAWLRVGP